MQYDPMDLTVTVGGVFITGFSEDLAEWEKDEDNKTAKVGAQGDVVTSKVNNPLATLTITLLPTSPQVAYLDKLAVTGQEVPVSVIYNGEPKESITCTRAFIKKPATRTYGNEAEDREYEIQMLDHKVN
ncbi:MULTISPECIES: phage structural protein [unclassified Paenibacillus]|uniref:phage structural protein n=1 Tax=unclassified Paenibacillus TaxID=185978 RepID=UPI001359F743|nr:phage protein [Paenibacillus sp. USDA918EY]